MPDEVDSTPGPAPDDDPMVTAEAVLAAAVRGDMCTRLRQMVDLIEGTGDAVRGAFLIETYLGGIKPLLCELGVSPGPVRDLDPGDDGMENDDGFVGGRGYARHGRLGRLRARHRNVMAGYPVHGRRGDGLGDMAEPVMAAMQHQVAAVQNQPLRDAAQALVAAQAAGDPELIEAARAAAHQEAQTVRARGLNPDPPADY